MSDSEDRMRIDSSGDPVYMGESEEDVTELSDIESKKVEKPKKKSKPRIVFRKMTSGSILKMLEKRPTVGYRNKRELCKWLEKEGKATIIW